MKMEIKSATKRMLRPILSFLSSLGVDPQKLVVIRHFPKYVSQYFSFKKLGGSVTHKWPIFSDFDEQAGSASGHYFHQDLLVARFVFEKKPERHLDIGSRIDGFVAHVASFRPIEVMDVRNLEGTGHENITFVQADLMKGDPSRDSSADSISCLHAIEHFGLGRYGDPLDPEGHKKGFDNILRMLKPNGTLYISFPIGRSNEVHFNAHRVFHQKDILLWSDKIEELVLERFDYVDDKGCLNQRVDLENAQLNVEYGCGIYTFKKRSGA